VTTITCLFIINKNQKKINIKLRKIDKRKRKILLLNHIIIYGIERFDIIGWTDSINCCLVGEFVFEAAKEIVTW